MTERFTPTTGDVFEDLGFPKAEAENRRVRSALMGDVRRIIEDRGMTRTEAAELFGMTRPRISDLVRGKIELFSIDALVNMLAAAGRRVEMSVGSGSDHAG